MGDPRSLFRTNYSYNTSQYNVQRLYGVSKGSLEFLQRLRVERKLSVHNGCVNTVCWNDTGQYILSGSDDQHLAITNPFTGKNIATIHSGHRANIFAAKFLPCTQDRHIISCSGDGTVFFTEVDREDTYGQHKFDCHFGTTYEVLTVPHDPNTFLSCGEDGTVRWFDLRTKTSCTKEDCKDDVLLNCKRPVTALCVNPMVPYQLGVACSDSSVRIYDRRMLGTRATGNYSAKGNTGLVARFTAPQLENRAHRVTSLQYSPDGEELLVSYSSELIYLFNMKEDGKREKELRKEAPATSSSDKEDNFEDPQPSTSGGEAAEGGRQPPVKRLRLRGDWSDTGPNARPERERGEEAPRSVTIMQRMSDMLSRWLDGSNRSSQQEGEGNEENREGISEAQERGENQATESQSGEAEAEAANHEGQSQPVDEAVASTSLDRKDCSAIAQEESDGAKENQERSKPSIEVRTDVNKSAELSVSDSQRVDISKNDGATLERESPLIDSPSQKLSQDRNDFEAKIAKKNETGAKDKTAKTVMPTSSEKCVEEQKHDANPELRVSTLSAEGTSSATGSSTPDVQSIRQSIQDIQVEPVISFQYNSEGTSASTISVDFQAMESVSCLPSTSASSAVEVSPQSVVPNKEGDSDSGSAQTVKTTLDKDSVHVSNGQKCEEVKCQEIAQSDNIKPERSGEDTHSTKQDESSKDAVAASEFAETCDGDKHLGDEPSGGQETDGSYDEFTDFDTASEDQNEEESEEHKDENEETSVTPQVTITAAPDPTVEEPDESTVAVDDQQGEETGSNVGASASASASEANTPTRLVARSRGVTGVSSSGRQRRMGHSGPPTGDFQLHSNSDSDDDSDSELMRAADRSRRSRDHMERNLAAIRLQELYRKKQEEREKVEREAMDLKQPAVKQVFRGHRNARTMIKEANFWGEHYVMSGSDCGHIFIWDRYTGKLVMLLEGDRHVVNCVQPHPYYPVLASSGIDYDVKVWMPIAEEPSFDEVQASEVMRRNEIMLEETRDTITVPASFMLRMLASLNNIRAGRRANQQEEEDSSSSSEDDGSFANNLFNDDNNNDSNNNV